MWAGVWLSTCFDDTRVALIILLSVQLRNAVQARASTIDIRGYNPDVAMAVKARLLATPEKTSTLRPRLGQVRGGQRSFHVFDKAPLFDTLDDVFLLCVLFVLLVGAGDTSVPFLTPEA